MSRAPSPSAIRLALYYAALFAMVGVHMPFWPVWLKAQGLDAGEIGIVLSAGIIAKILANPLAAHLADRSGERRRPMILLALGATLAFALFAATGGFWTILGVTLMFFLFWAPIIPLGESLAMLTVERTGIDYARTRLWGSIAFIVAAVAAGQVLVDTPESILFSLVLGLLLVCLAGVSTLPDERAPPATGRAPIGSVLADRRFLLFLAATALIQGSHGVYYAFGTIHWRSVGYSEDIIGWLWAEGVIAEIVLFTWGTRLLRRFGAARLIMAGGVAAALRWGITGATDALPALVVVQALHAFTFGAAHLGAIHFITQAVAPSRSATAQSLYSAVVMGLGLGGAIFAAGHLYGAFGSGAFHAMAVAGGLGALLALRLAATERS